MHNDIRKIDSNQLSIVSFTCCAQPSSFWYVFNFHVFKVKPLLAFCTQDHLAIICLWKTTSAVQLDSHLFGITPDNYCRILSLRESTPFFSFKTMLKM